MQVTYDSFECLYATGSSVGATQLVGGFAVAFCVACLITVEFLPVSLLTPMAQDLGISEGVAGQSVTTTAFVAMFASLFITSIIRSTDRRYVVILFSVLLTLSCLLVSLLTALRYCCSAAPASGWRWAAFGLCRRRSPCGWCRCAWCPKPCRLFWRGIDSAGDRRAAGQLSRWDYRLA